MLDFQNKFALANFENQLQPSKVSSNVWVGPLNSVAQPEFLTQNNIRYIIGVMPSQKCAYYLKDKSENEVCCLSIDPNFSAQKLTEDEGELIMTFNSKFSRSISTLTDNKITNSVITNINFQKIMDDFLTVIHEIQNKDPSTGILLFSLNGNDNMLASFALAYIQDALNCDVPASFSYLKSIRPSIRDFDEMGFYASELVKFHLSLKAKKQFGAMPSLKTKRSVLDVTDHDELELDSPRSIKRTM